METATCANTDVAEVGFVGRTLLNAFNALEYGKQQNRQDLVDNANHIFDTYLQNGFSPAGFFNEVVHYNRGFKETRHSIRRQSEGVYAILNYLNYEKQQKRKHPEWEKRIKGMLDSFLKLQNEDGSFPRKFKDDFSIVDASGGSTPSATLPLVMASKYFKDKRYLASAKRTVDYLEKELISKADYFSSTLDANCEDKEASLYAATAATRNELYRNGKKIEILVNFCPKLHYVSEWWKQLYGESEGKDNKGIFPASVDFSTDLHSMGQWIQEGERSIFETVISLDKVDHKLEVPSDEANLDGLNFLAGKRVDEVNKMAELGTQLAHVDGGVPNMRIVLPSLSEYNIGSLLYFFEKACGISGYLLGVNPFNQPGVEAYKKNMFALLNKPGYEEESKAIQSRL